MAEALTVVLVFPELLGTYGDGGNALVLAQRARWRGVPATIATISLDEPVPSRGDLYVLGGGEDSGQVLAADRLRRSGGLRAAAERGAPVLAICAGLQIIGASFEDEDGRCHDGIGLVEATSWRRQGPRAVGELLVRPSGGRLISGFENHQGVTVLGQKVRPLGSVVVGVGNGDGSDGLCHGRIVATYAHGPLLARNPDLADLLLGHVLGELSPLDDTAEEALLTARLAAAGHPSPGRRRPRAWPSTAATPDASTSMVPERVEAVARTLAPPLPGR